MYPSSPPPKPTSQDIAAIRNFMSWGAKQREFPYGSISYWLTEYEKTKEN